MSSSLEYLLSSFEEETTQAAAAAATPVEGCPCYQSGSWIASGASSSPTAPRLDDPGPSQRIRNASVAASYPYYNAAPFSGRAIHPFPSGTSAISSTSVTGASGVNAAPLSSIGYQPRPRRDRFRFPHEGHVTQVGPASLFTEGAFDNPFEVTALGHGEYANDEGIEEVSIHTIGFSGVNSEEQEGSYEYSLTNGAVEMNSNNSIELTSLERENDFNRDHLGEATSTLQQAVASPASEPRARRKAAISCLERISTAIATDGMGVQFSKLEDNDVKDCKPSAKPLRHSIRKRSNSDTARTMKKRTFKETEDDKTPVTCCICLDFPKKEELASISGCSHPFCFRCIEKWADRENTCPLCKSRFVKIERVHTGVSRSKKMKSVATRNQRSDFQGTLDGILEDIDSAGTGTWPTHIAQLLFSGLGASSIPERGDRNARMGVTMRHLSDVNPFPRVERRSSLGGPSHVYTSTLSRTQATSTRDFLDPAPEEEQHVQRLRENVEARTSLYSSTAVLDSSSAPYLSPSFRSTRIRSTTTTESSSPWGASRLISIHSHIDSTARVDSTVQLTSLALTPPAPVMPFASSPSISASGSSSNTTAGNILQNPYAPIDIAQMEEEEDILSVTSPSSFLQRLQRELERNTESYLYTAPVNNDMNNTRMNIETVFDPPAFHRSPFDSRNESLRVSRNNEIGRSAETALEIDDSESDDDDVVEVIAVETMM